MRPIAAIALLALRHALRSRVVAVLFVLLLAASFLLPLALRSDGTPAGLVRLHLAYALGGASFLLTLASLWTGSAAIAQEADAHTLPLLLVKPVARLQIWLGKWIALLILNAGLLALVGAAAGGALHLQLRRGGFSDAALAAARQTSLAALRTLRAPLPDLEAEVRAEYESLRARGALPDNLPESVALDSLRRTRLARLYAIPPQTSRTWTFPAPPAPPAYLIVQFKCDSSVPGLADIRAALALHAGDRIFSREIPALPGTQQTIVFGGPGGSGSGANRLAVTFSNRGTHDATLFFDPADGLVLRVPAGGFAGNYLRALAALYFRLALFAAIGVTLGTLFSLPVATFLTLVLLLILQLAGFIVAAAQVDRDTFVANVAPFGAAAGPAGDGAAAGAPAPIARAAATVFYYAYRGTYLALRPLLEDRTIDELATGTWLPPRALLRNGLRQGVALPGLLALLSAAVLKKREWALPSSDP